MDYIGLTGCRQILQALRRKLKRKQLFKIRIHGMAQCGHHAPSQQESRL